MSYSATPSRDLPPKAITNVTCLLPRQRFVCADEQFPFRLAWTEELERRRRAVARWRGSDHALKETMMRKSRSSG